MRNRDRGEDDINCHGRGQWADRVKPRKLWRSLWMARGAGGAFWAEKLYDLELDLTE